jgi:CRP/FNR family transcriptional regulator, cyclic AMP receptor protein
MESAIQDSCFECLSRPDRLFCDLPADALQAFDSIKATAQYQRESVIFREGQSAHAIFIVCEGRVRLSLCAENGKRITFRVAGPGEVLGLSATVCGGAYEVTAEPLETSRLATVRRKDLLRFLRQYREACLHVVNLLSQDLHTAYDRVRAIGLGRGRRSRGVHVH